MKKRWKIWLAAALVLCVLLGLEIWRSNCRLTVTHYQIENQKLTAPVRIVQLTDLHNASFGPDNADLVALVAEQAPDLILFTGDLVTRNVQQTETAEALLKKLSEIAPVYVSLGNHETAHEKNFGTDLTALFTQCGAKVMEFSYEDVTVVGQRLRIGGISGYCVPDIYLKTGEARMEECEFLWDFQDTDRCSVLLCHMPVTWIYNDGISHWDADLVFAGHAHGGQIVLPLLGPVAAPDMGLFPGRLEGIFSSGDGEKHLVLSSGLGNSVFVPRLNNPPQIMVVDILPKQ